MKLHRIKLNDWILDFSLDIDKTVKCYDDDLKFEGWLYFGTGGLKILLKN
jgi:hypothetical protein